MSRRQHAQLALIALAVAAALIGLAGDSSCVLAQSPSCRSNCLAQYNQCRIISKGSPACDSQYQACLQSCMVSPR